MGWVGVLLADISPMRWAEQGLVITEIKGMVSVAVDAAPHLFVYPAVLVRI